MASYFNPYSYIDARSWSMAAKPEQRFRDKAVLITGATSDLGPVMARALLDEGAKSVFLSGRDTRRLQEVAQEISRETLAQPCDLARGEAIDAFVQATPHAFDLVICAAGAWRDGAKVSQFGKPLAAVDDAHLANALAVPTGHIRLIAALLRHQRLRPGAQVVLYSCAFPNGDEESAVCGLPFFNACLNTQTAARTLAHDAGIKAQDVKIYAICPEFISTQGVCEAFTAEERLGATAPEDSVRTMLGVLLRADAPTGGSFLV